MTHVHSNGKTATTFLQLSQDHLQGNGHANNNDFNMLPHHKQPIYDYQYGGYAPPPPPLPINRDPPSAYPSIRNDYVHTNGHKTIGSNRQHNMSQAPNLPTRNGASSATLHAGHNHANSNRGSTALRIYH